MDSKKLEILMTAVNLGSFSKASEVVGYTQSGLTHLINGLEREIGMALIRRDHSGISLTENGEALLPAIRDYLSATAKLENQIAAHIRAARERGTAFIKKLDDSLGFSGNAQAARLLPEGVAVPLKTLAAAHPSLAAAVERKIQNSKMGETVPELRRLCDGSRLAAGILSLPEEESEALRETLFSSAGADGDEMAELTPEQEDALRWIVFAALPSKDGRLAVVEFAFPNEEAATYLFRMEEPWEAFLTLLNRALEATGLRREILSLPEERLHDEANADTRMAVIRTPAVRSLRARFTGRVIHRGLDAWRSGLIKQLAPSALQGVEEYRPKFCGSCGAPLTTGARFCGICGAGQG